MTISNAMAVGFALIPGAAETIESQATNTGNLGMLGIARNVKHARNALYVSATVTAIAATAAALSDPEKTIRQYACATVATLGTGLTTVAAMKLYGATLYLQTTLNSLLAQRAAINQIPPPTIVTPHG